MNPCEEYELLLSARLDGALSLKEETQLHAHLAQCPHCRQLAQELEDLQTQMTSLWVEPPDSLKDALASQDWSKSASSSPPRSPTASPSKRRHLLPWLARAAAAVVLVVGLCQLLLPGGADGLLPKAVIEVFQRPEQDPAAGSEESRSAAPDNPDSPQDPSKDTEQQAEQNGGDAQGEAPSPSDRPTAPNDTEDPQSPPNNNQTPNNPSNPSGDPRPRGPRHRHTSRQQHRGQTRRSPRPRGEPAGSPVAAHGLSGPAGTDPHPGAFGLQSQPRLLALFRPGCQRQRRHVPDGLLLHRTDSRDSRPAVLHGARTGITGRK